MPKTQVDETQVSELDENPLEDLFNKPSDSPAINMFGKGEKVCPKGQKWDKNTKTCISLTEFEKINIDETIIANTDVGEVELPEVSPTNPVGYVPDDPEQSNFYNQTRDTVNSITEIQANPIMETEGYITTPSKRDLYGLDMDAVTLINVEATTEAINKAAEKAPSLLTSKEGYSFADIPTDDKIKDISKRIKAFENQTGDLIKEKENKLGRPLTGDEEYDITMRPKTWTDEEDALYLESEVGELGRTDKKEDAPAIGALFNAEGGIAVDITQLDDLEKYFSVDKEAYKYIKDSILSNKKFADYNTWEQYAQAGIEQVQALIRKDPVVAKIFANSNTILANESKEKFVDILDKYQGKLDTPEGIEAAQNEYDTWQKNRWNELILTNENYNSRALQYEFAAHQVLKDLYVPFGRTKENFLFDLDKDLAEGKISKTWWQAKETLYGAYMKAKQGVKGYGFTDTALTFQKYNTTNQVLQNNLPTYKRLGLENKTVTEILSLVNNEEYLNSLSQEDQGIIKKLNQEMSSYMVTSIDKSEFSEFRKKPISTILEDIKKRTNEEAISLVEKVGKRMEDSTTLSLLSEIDPDATDFFSDVRRVLDQSNMLIMGTGMALKTIPNPYAKAVGGLMDVIASVDIISQTISGDLWAALDSKIRTRKGENYQPTKEDYLTELEDPDSINMFNNILSTGIQFGMERFSMTQIIGLGKVGTNTITSLLRGQFGSFIKQLPGLALKRELAGFSEYVTEGTQGLVSDANVRFQTSGNIMEAVSNAEFDTHGAKVGYRTGRFLFGAGVVVNQSAIELNSMALQMADRFNLSEIAPTWVNTERTFNAINDLIRKRITSGSLSQEEGSRQLNEISNYRNQGMKIPSMVDGRTRPRLLRLLLQQSKLTDSIKKTDNKDLSGPELLKLVEVSSEIESIINDANNRKDYLTQVGNVANIINANTKANVKIIKSKNAKGVDNQIERLKEEGWKIAASKGMSTNYGTILQQGDNQVILLNENEILKDGAINTAAHEFLHAVLWQTVKNSKGTAINLGNKLVEYLVKANPELMKNSEFKKRLQQYIDDPKVATEQQAEEVLTLFSEAVLDGAISEADFNKWHAPISDMIRRVYQSLGFGNIRFDSGQDVYNFIKDFNRSIKKGKFTQAQQTLFGEGATGDLVKRKYIKGGPGTTSTIGARKGIKEPEEVIIKDSKKLDDLTKDYKKDKNTADVLELTEQYTAASIDALQRWAKKRGVPFQLYNDKGGLTLQGQEALGFINKEFADIMRTVEPGPGQSVTNYLDKAIGPRVGDKLVKEHKRTSQQVSQDVLTEKGVEPKAEKQPDFDIKADQDIGRKKMTVTNNPVIQESVSPQARNQIKEDSKSTIATLASKGKTPSEVVNALDTEAKGETFKDIKGKKTLASRAYNNFINKLFDSNFVKAISVADMKSRFPGLFNVKQISTTPTTSISPKTGKKGIYNKQVFDVKAPTKQELKNYFLPPNIDELTNSQKDTYRKRANSLFNLISKDIALESLSELKNDPAFMELLQANLENQNSPFTAEQFMAEIDNKLNRRNLEDTSLDKVKASKKRNFKLSTTAGKTAMTENYNVWADKNNIIVEFEGETIIGPLDHKNPLHKKYLKNIIENEAWKYLPLEIFNAASLSNAGDKISLIEKYNQFFSGKQRWAIIAKAKKNKAKWEKENGKVFTPIQIKNIKIAIGQKSFDIDMTTSAYQTKIDNNYEGVELILQGFANMVKANPTTALAITGILQTSSSSSGHWVRQFAIPRGKSQDFINRKGKRHKEHVWPANNVMSLMFDAILKNQVKAIMPAIKKNYFQIGVSAIENNKLADTSGQYGEIYNLNLFTPVSYIESVQDAINAGDINLAQNILIRYFNEQVNQNRNGGSPGFNSNQMIVDGKTVAEQFTMKLPLKLQTADNIFYQNELTYLVLNGTIDQATAIANLKIALPVNKAKADRAIAQAQYNVLVTPNMRTETQKKINENSLTTRQLASKKRPRKGISVFDFDDTIAKTKEKVIVYAPYYSPGKMTETRMELAPAEFAERALELENAGASFDFSQFENVKNAKKGPLANLALKRQGKFGSKDIFILTARPQIAAAGIKKFLDGIGLEIPLENITGLENGTPQAKANWVLQKTADGYNDFYFADDSIKNVKAVKQVLDVIDIKGDYQVAKASKKRNLDTEFNKQIEEVTGKEAYKEFSKTRAKLEGKARDKGFFKWLGKQLTITPSAEDFMGIMYDLIGKGKQGNRHAQFILDNLMKPFNKAEQAILSAKVTVANDFAALKKTFPSLRTKMGKNPLMQKIGIGPFTKSNAIRVYMWTKQGMDIPGLSKRDQNALVKAVEADSDLQIFADEVILIQKEKMYPPPSNNWTGGDISTDILQGLDKGFRNKLMTEFNENAAIIFSEKNMNKLEALFGTKWVDALKDSLRRMKSGSNRPVYQGGGSRIVNELLDWLNGSVGAIMFLNMRSGLLQLISNVNFINWGDNNMYQAAKAFASKEYWPTVMKLMNSDYLVNRRDGLKINVNEAELADAAKKSGMKGAIAYLLDKGFIITRIMDSLAIATGGATFYMNRRDALLKRQNPETGKKYTKAEAETQAFNDFYAIAEETQQSSNPSKISQQQASLAGRVILSFQNVTMQYNRKTKKSIRDLWNRRKKPGMTQRESDMGNLSSIIYYTTIQNIIFP